MKFPDNDVVQYLAATNDVALGELQRARARRVEIDALRSDIESRIIDHSSPAPSFLRATTTAPQTPPRADLRALIALIAQDRLTPEQRVTLDNLTFAGNAKFDPAQPSPQPGTTVFESGRVDDVAFRFSEPTAFNGTFRGNAPMRLTYRILGVTQWLGSDALLIEAIRLEPKS